SDSGDIDAVVSVAWEAVAAAQQNADAANEAGSRLQEASQALGNSSAALSQDQQTMAEAARQARDMTGAGLAGENSTDLSSVVKGLQALSEGLGQLSEIGRASCRERVEMAVDEVSVVKKYIACREVGKEI